MLTLWDFSLRLYAMPGVPDACLHVQDQYGVDVNLLMFAVWAGYGCGIVLSRSDLADADAQVRAWRTDVVQPLRTVRRQLKSAGHAEFHEDASTLRQRTKELELDAERLLQEHLGRFLLSRVSPRPSSLESALHNLAQMLAPPLAPDDSHLQDLQTALRALHDPTLHTNFFSHDRP